MSRERLLAIESATERGGVALVEAGAVLGARALDLRERHAAALLPAVDALLRETGYDLAAVSAIALSIGPGSFTGLRVGLATALGLCFGTPRPIVPVPTLAALSLAAGPVPRSVPLLDARRGQVYAGCYGPGGEPLAEDRVVEPEPWLASLRGLGPLAFLGSGADRYADRIRAVLGPDARVLPAASGIPRAEQVALLGERLAQRGGALPPEQVRLRYLRPPEAEARRGAASGP